jgi:hypothetical protein
MDVPPVGDMGSDSTPSPDAVRRVIREVLDLCRVASSGSFAWRAGVRPVVVITMHGLVAHCHLLAEAVMLLDREGYRLEVNPLVRAAYESALTASWLAHVADAPEAFVNSEWGNRRHQLSGIAAAWGPQVPQTEIDAAIARQPAEPYKTSSQSSAKYFERLCDDQRGVNAGEVSGPSPAVNA